MGIKAAVFSRPGQPLELVEVAEPQLADGEALVRLDCCTLCGSDLHSISGRRQSPRPCILGHEMLGSIESIGGNVLDYHGDPLARGDRVTWSIAASCGECFFCEAGAAQKCEQLFKYGHQRFDPEADLYLTGGMATHCHLANSSHIFKLPESLPDNVACPANCATATVAAACRVAGQLENKAVLVTGCGMLGLTAAAMARHLGARQVVVADVDTRRLEIACQFGADQAILLDALRPIESHVDQFRTAFAPTTDERGPDVVLEMSGAVPAIQSGLACLRIGGAIILVGSVFPSGTIAVDPETLVRRLIRIEGIHNYLPVDLAGALEFLSTTDFPFAQLVGPEFPLARVGEAVSLASERQIYRVAIRPNLVHQS